MQYARLAQYHSLRAGCFKESIAVSERHVYLSQRLEWKQCVTETGPELVGMSLVQHNTLELGLEPLDRILLCHAVRSPNLHTTVPFSLAWQYTLD